MEKLNSKGWIEIDEENQTMHLINLKHLNHLASQ
jgi:hypothetical protein